MQHARRFASHDIVERRVAIMAEASRWNRERVLKWDYAQAILSAIWSIEDKQEPDAALAIAKVLAEMI
jgi:streptomycin 6-kinase